MNAHFSTFLNIYRNAIAKKKKKQILNFSHQNLINVQFMVKNGFISGFHSMKQRKKKYIIIFLRYTPNHTANLYDLSIVSKRSFRNNLTEKTCEMNNNFILNLKFGNSRYSQILSRLR